MEGGDKRNQEPRYEGAPDAVHIFIMDQLIAACAAASLAIGTLYGEQDT